MSDSADDIDDELFALATSSNEKKKKKRSGTSSKISKKRKADMTDSEEEEDNPYPLEGKYVDEADRQRLMQMSEMEREEILASRMEVIEKANMKRQLKQMVRDQTGAGSESVSRAAKRVHTARGATTEKTRKLDELKAKRKARDQKHRGSPRRDRSSSPMDMDISDDESEEGQFTKDDEEEERAGKLLNKSPVDEPINMSDLESVRLTRNEIAKHYLAPWFQDYVQDAWVRYLVGPDSNSQPVYRICEVKSLGSDLVKPYKVNDQTANQAFELKHGKSVRAFPMDKVSNSPFEPREFDRLQRVCTHEQVKLPTKKQIKAKSGQMGKLVNQPVTESDISARLARKNELSAHRPSGLSTIEKSRLHQARTLALRRQDFAEVAEIEAKLAELAPNSLERSRGEDSAADVLAKVNERNRKANLEAIRKAELAEAERKRKERKLNASGTATPVDPSARLKTVPRLFNAATPTTRPGTPVVDSKGTANSVSNGTETPNAVKPLPSSSLSNSLAPKAFEAAVIDSIEIDLGDF